MDKKIEYRLRFWYGLKEHIVPIGTADAIIQNVWSEMYPTYSVEQDLWGKGRAYQITINFKEMKLEIVAIDVDGESILPQTKTILNDELWTIEWNEEDNILEEI